MRTRPGACPLLTAVALMALVVATTTCTSPRPTENSAPVPAEAATPAPSPSADPAPTATPDPAEAPDPTPSGEAAPGSADEADDESADDGDPTDDAPAPSAEALPKQGKACDDGRCADGLRCLEYYGIAGARGPKFSSCEIPCSKGAGCPTGQRCVTIADGPGQVCRPAS